MEVAFRRPERSHYQRARPTEVPKVRSAGERPPQLVVWGGVLVISYLGYEVMLMERQSSGGMIIGPSPRSARWPIGIAAFGLCLPFLIRIKNSGSARERRWQQQKGRGPCSCCARPPLSQWGSRFGIYYKI
ncbi:hypothetical protein RJ640_029007 [Escallonia rubra]|uniref:Uncharacterized protein n=1 Tax=Escallonia rubra TaxID=112253 RepID=A0AA88S495_9ASTE|nr:hypothetical protein RJ640_029007 [Escallonia rubra]